MELEGRDPLRRERLYQWHFDRQRCCKLGSFSHCFNHLQGNSCYQKPPRHWFTETASALKRNSQGLLLVYNRSEFFRSLNIKQNHTTKQRQSRVTSGQQKCRNTVRKAKEQNELQLVWNIKGTQKDATRSEKQSGQVMVQQRGTAKMMQSRVGCSTLNICLNFHK